MGAGGRRRGGIWFRARRWAAEAARVRPRPALHGPSGRRALYLGVHSDVESHWVGSASASASACDGDGLHPLGAGTRRRAGDCTR